VGAAEGSWAPRRASGIRLVKGAGLIAIERTRRFRIGTRMRRNGRMMVNISPSNSSAKLPILEEVAISVAIRMSLRVPICR